MKTIVTAIALIAAATGAAAHTPSPSPLTRSETVSYLDLDLASAAGQKTLAKRINQAATRVCSETSARDDFFAWVDATNCKRHAVEQAMAIAKTRTQFADARR